METERLYSKHCEQSNFKNYDIKTYKYLQVTTTFIVGFQHYDNCDYIYVKVCLSNYEDNLEILTTLYFEVIMNNKNEIDNEKNTSNCENCGAKMELNNIGTCEYCKSNLINGNYSWVMSKINDYTF